MLEPARYASLSERRHKFLQALQPPPQKTVAEYADEAIYLPSFVSEPGRWRTSRTPFLKEIMECLSPRHRCKKVSLMKPVQIGGTQILVNWAGYTMDCSPTSMIIFEPIIEMVKGLVKEKLDPMIQCSPSLKTKVKDARARDSGNTTFRKEFLGGFLKLLWANSSKAARSTSARRIALDEVDEYEHDVGGQGHACDLIEKRAASYGNYKIFELSTPTFTETSRIESQYLLGSQGRYHVPCPFCRHLQHLVWERLIYTFDGVKRPDDAAYQCERCEALIPERYKTWMMDDARATWVHAYPERLDEHASFHINLLYQPYGWAYPWARLAKEYIKAYTKMKAGDTAEMKTFRNTILALTWKDTYDKVEWEVLQHRREIYETPVPRGVVLLTAAVDVQDNRLEAELVGWGIGEESWSLDYRIFRGSPAFATVWAEVTDWLQAAHVHPCGLTMRVEAVGLDTGGHHTKETYQFVERYRGIAFAFKGSSKDGAPPVPKREPNRFRNRRFKLYLLGTNALKDTIFARLKLTEPGPGYMHFPRRDGYDDDYFKGLTSEVKKPKCKPRSSVQIGTYYEKVYQRNEPLDLKVMNQAVLALITGKKKLTDWAKRIESYVPQLEIPTDPETGEQPQESVEPEQPAAQKLTEQASFVKPQALPGRRRGGFVKGWR